MRVWPNSLAINDLAHSSYVACLGGGDPAQAPRYTALYEEQPFNGMFHRNRAIRHAEITDGTSNTLGLGERASMFAPNGWAGVVPNGQTVFSTRIAQSRGQAVGDTARPAITMATCMCVVVVPMHRRQPRWILESSHRRRPFPAHGRLNSHDCDQRRHDSVSRHGRPQ